MQLSLLVVRILPVQESRLNGSQPDLLQSPRTASWLQHLSPYLLQDMAGWSLVCEPSSIKVQTGAELPAWLPTEEPLLSPAVEPKAPLPCSVSLHLFPGLLVLLVLLLWSPFKSFPTFQGSLCD